MSSNDKQNKHNGKKQLYVDCSNYSFGRIASFASKKALEGYDVYLFNVENLLITGNKKNILDKFMWKRRLKNKANPEHSPKLPRVPNLMVKRMIRGMLPYRTKHGRDAFKRIIVYNGLPQEFRDKKFIELPFPKKQYSKFMTILDICKHLGYVPQPHISN
ncbi:MAG: 50S ribosomal protein L13 [Candidatus Micrarchaeota archaeon]|nr:50S ribosomal protein L13 [Candidatus Micrarchaeota archaeon]